MNHSKHFLCCLLAGLTVTVLAQSGCKASCRRGTSLKDGVCVSSQEETAAAGTEEETADPAADPAAVAPTNTATDVQGAASAAAGNTGTLPNSANGAQNSPPSAAGSSQGGTGGATADSSTEPQTSPSEPADQGAMPNQSTDPASSGAPVMDAGSPNMPVTVDSGPPCIPQPEECDGQDNDCDMAIDEDIEPMPCGIDRGICKPGTIQCRNGKWDDPETQCQGAVGPRTEVCDAERLDEDCNGIPNDGCECADGEMMECAEGPFTCRKGIVTCRSGRWSACQGEQKGTAEICDGLDNDCDGTRDNGGDRLCTGRGTPFCTGSSGCAECRQDSDCPKSANPCDLPRCSNGRCGVETAANRTRCSTEEWDGFCSGGECVECLANTDCPSAYTCNALKCQAPRTAGAFKGCSAPQDCAEPFTCQTSNRMCTRQCNADAACIPNASSEGAACYGQICYIDCASNSDCPSGTTCNLSVKFPKTEGGTTTGVCTGN